MHCAPVNAIDAHVFRFLYHALSGPWVLPLVFLSAIGGGWGAFLVLPLYLVRRTRPLTRPLALVLVTTASLVWLLKRMVGRIRPYARLEDVKALAFSAPTDFSFPSGHAAGSFAFCIFLATILVRSDVREHRALRFAMAAGLVLLATGVGLSRIALGVHFPGDVLGGAILGATIASVGAHLHIDRRRRGVDAGVG